MTINLATVTKDILSVHRQDDATSEQVSQLLYGEHFIIETATDSWCYGRCVHDNYPGFVARVGLIANAPAATHKLKVPAAHAFAEASIKSAIVHQLYLGARVRVEGITGDFAQLADGSFVRQSLLDAADNNATDWTERAGHFLDTPYLWGGRSRAGLDCSGLVQLVLNACGLSCPRDTADQRQLGAAVDPAQLQRGDLIFFPGHVGIMWDSVQLLHANAFHMCTLIEPLADVIARLAPLHADPLVAARRLV